MTTDLTIKVRLLSISHDKKYHEIDYVALSVGPQPKITVTNLPLQSAGYGGNDVLPLLNIADDQYVQMGSGNKFSASFAELPVKEGEVRDFILVSEGYYVPHSDTFFIYTWDGAKWAQRDSYSFPATDTVRTFDLSSVLPDPTGRYRVRIWQDYSNFPAAIDFIKMQVGTQIGTITYAAELPSQNNILSLVSASDDIRFVYPLDPVNKRPQTRNTGYIWSGLPANFPPVITGLTVQGETFRWTYSDNNGDPQSAFDLQVWTGPQATGICIWSPSTVGSNTTSTVYNGPSLTPATTYYVRVRLNDSISWGGWAETSFVTTTAPQSINITTSATPDTGGSISGGGTYSYNGAVTLTATANTGYQFVSWMEGTTVVSTTAVYTFKATASRELVANFVPNSYTIGVSATPGTGGSVSGGGTYSYNGAVTVNATANTGYQFVNWMEGTTVVSTSATYTFNATASRELVANFAVITFSINVIASPPKGGKVSGGGIFSYNSAVSITATANSDYQFNNWTEGSTVVSTNPVYSFNATDNRFFTANFSVKTFVITTAATLANAITGQYYEQRLEATGGSTPYRWNIIAGNLPAGFTLDSSSGMISGTTNKTAKLAFTVQVTDTAGATDSRKFTIRVGSR